MTEDEMVGWHYQFDGRDFEQVPGFGDANQTVSSSATPLSFNLSKHQGLFQ